MDWMKAIGGLAGGIGESAEKNAARPVGGAPAASPTSGFIQAARQAAVDRQQAQAAQVQTTPTAMAGLGAATPGGAMTQLQPPAPIGGGTLPTMQSQGVLSLPPQGGMATQGTADPELLAAMYRGF